MYSLLRKILFALPPDVAHRIGMFALSSLPGLLTLDERPWTNSQRVAVRTRSMGDLVFRTPIGIAGGFDKNAEVVDGLATVGFGFLELGTVTAQAQDANPVPNMFRLPADRALVNRLGFPNEGASAVVRRFVQMNKFHRRPHIPIGFSIGKSRAVPIEPLDGALDDYEQSFRTVHPVADFVVVNVSSPNTKGLRALQSGDVAKQLFARLQAANRALGPKPLLVKVAPDLSDDDYEAFLSAVQDEGLAGVIATNTTIRRDGLGLRTSAEEIARIGDGGLSGPPLAARARTMVRRARERLGDHATVIGVGGVETTDDVLAMLRAGADLVQMYTGFVYGGPGLPRRMVYELLERISAAGATSLAELVAATESGAPYR